MVIQKLLSLPPGMASQFGELESRPQPEWFATCNPAGSKLGSGGGTAHLLAEAWQANSDAGSFDQWLSAGRIRYEFNTNPPNSRARFVEMTLSESGL